MVVLKNNLVKTLILLLIISCSKLSYAKSRRISFEDIEGNWLHANMEPTSENCNEFGPNGEIYGDVGISIKGKILEGYEISCKIYDKYIKNKSTIVLRTDCGQEGDHVKNIYYLTLKGNILKSSVYSSFVGRNIVNRYEGLYTKAHCDTKEKSLKVEKDINHNRCPWMEATFRTRPLEDGRVIEVQFYKVASAGPVTLRGLDSVGNLEWTLEAEYSCSNGLPLCWMSFASKNNSESNSDVSVEIIDVSSNKSDLDIDNSDIVVLAGIPQYFKALDVVDWDIKFVNNDASKIKSIYVPEVYYYYHCK